jgi:2-polyprenyl-3-methyl-5-hydroxy-6-metoxy-1,4-benzoquinol methylase
MDNRTSERISGSNSRARANWESRAVGQQRSAALPGSKTYFEDLKRYRFGYETPFIPRVFAFSSMSGQSVLEIGVGNGIDAGEIITHGANYYGVDITLNHINLTERYIKILRSLNKVTTASKLYHSDLLSIRDLPKFDIVYSFGVLHHIEHEIEYLIQINKLLRPGGELKVSFYANFSLFNFWMIVTWIFLNKTRNSLDEWRSHIAEGSSLTSPVVIKIRSKRDLVKMLDACGFRVVRYHKCGFVKRYLPIIGNFLKPDGLTLNFFGKLLGWYHCFICVKDDRKVTRGGVS